MKIRKIINYGLLVFLFAEFVYMLFSDNKISEYYFGNIREIIIPSYNDNMIERNVKKQIVPQLAMSDDMCWCDENDLSYDDFLEYSAINNVAVQNFETATNGDAKPIIVQGDTYRSNDDSEMEISYNDVEETENEKDDVAAVVSINNVNGINYDMKDLQDFDFLVTNCYAVDNSTSVNPDELDVNNLLSRDLSIDMTGDDYKVLIYHTHGSEEFANSREGVLEDTVIGVGDELTRILEEDYGIKTYHDRTIYDVIDGELDRSYAYDMASVGVDKILEEYPSIEVVLDIHRDGVRDDVYLVRNIDGRATAQIMFLNGVSRSNTTGDIEYLYNPNKIDNLSFSLQMHLIGKQMYGDLMRRIYIRSYCYNLDKKPRASLIEVGAQTNTVEEAKNAMIPLGAILYRVLAEK